MKYARKFIGMLLTLILVFSLNTVAFAADETGSITINNAVSGQTYTIYRILDLESYNASAGAYSYKAADAWSDFINGSDVKGVYVDVDSSGYVTWKGSDDDDAAAFSKLALKYAKEKGIANEGTLTAASATVSFTGLSLGYYLVDTTLGTLCSLDTTNPDVEMREKNTAPTNVKTIVEGSNTLTTNDVSIGDTVNFKSTITAWSGAENYTLHDTMSDGLTFNGSVSVTLNGTNVSETNDYTLVTNSGDCTFEVRFTQSFCDTLKDNDSIVVSYSAVLNENAVIAGSGNTNKSYLTYGDNGESSTAESQTVTYTWKMPVFKYTLPVPDGETNVGGANTNSDGDAFGDNFFDELGIKDDDVSISMLTTGKKTDVAGAKAYNDDVGIALLANEADQKMPVAGATFTLSKNSNGSNPINLVSMGTANQYRVAKTGEQGAFTGITTDTSGEFAISGLDSGTYYLTETGTPAGFNSLSGSVKVEIGTNGAITVDNTIVAVVEILNNSGNQLPSTGGIGTYIFYFAGFALILTAAVLPLIRKYRKLHN